MMTTFRMMRIVLKDVVGYYSIYNDSKKMNFKLIDELYHKLSDILEHIHEKLNIYFGGFKFVKKEFFKAKVSNETCFKEDIKATLILKEGKVIPKECKTIFTPDEGVMCTCTALLQTQSIFFNIKDSKYDIRYYPQLLLEQCAYNRFINNIIFHPDLEFKDTEPDSDFESEEEINENTVFDEHF